MGFSPYFCHANVDKFVGLAYDGRPPNFWLCLVRLGFRMNNPKDPRKRASLAAPQHATQGPFSLPAQKIQPSCALRSQFSPDRAEFGASGPRSNAARWGRRGKRFWHESIAGPPSQRPAVSRLPHSLVFPRGINAKAAAGQPFVDSSRAAQ